MTTRFAEPMARLIEELKRLPGVGSKSAQRLAFHILRSSDADARNLAAAISEIKRHLRLCSVCNNITDIDPCLYCANPVRNQRQICVVEEPTNIAVVERTRSYNGVYHVLHGTLSPLGGVGPEHLRTANLMARLPEVEEVVLALSPTTEGEATAVFLAHAMHEVNAELKVTRIATGVPAGSDIEYTDEVTMTRAMEGRRSFGQGAR